MQRGWRLSPPAGAGKRRPYGRITAAVERSLPTCGALLYTHRMSTDEKNRGDAGDADRQIAALRQCVRGYGGLAVAFSGGADSTLLALIARQELGDRAIAVTACSPTYPSGEEAEARRLAALMGIRHEMVNSNELEIPGFAENPPDRCYSCKRELFLKVKEVAARFGITTVADGTNKDDLSDYRPGRQAATEAGVVSPFLEVGMGKEAVRECSRRLGLITADKPAYACLASRFPYGERITEEKLIAIEKVERKLRELEFILCRVRFHGHLARIEVPPRDIQRLCQGPIREEIAKAAHDAGFKFVTMDMDGYRMGSMNATLPKVSAGDAKDNHGSAPAKK